MSLAFATNGSLAHEVALVADQNDRLVLVEDEYVFEYVDGYVEAGAVHHSLAENLAKIDICNNNNNTLIINMNSFLLL